MNLNDVELHAKRIISKHGFTPQTERGPESLTLRITRKNGEAIGAVTFPRALVAGNKNYIMDKIEKETISAIAIACREATGR